jgi:hypothetical protein
MGSTLQPADDVDRGHFGVRGVNYFCRLATTISAGEGLANEPTVDRSGAR